MIKNFKKSKKNWDNLSKCKKCMKYFGINYCTTNQDEKQVTFTFNKWIRIINAREQDKTKLKRTNI